MLTPEQKVEIIRWICSTEPKSICETRGWDFDEHIEEEIDMLLTEIEDTLVEKYRAKVDDTSDSCGCTDWCDCHEQRDGPSGQCPETP